MKGSEYILLFMIDYLCDCRCYKAQSGHKQFDTNLKITRAQFLHDIHYGKHV